MRNILEKIVIVTFIVFIIFTCLQNTTYAIIEDIMDSGDNFIKNGVAGVASDSPINEDALKTTSGDIFNILFAIAVVLAMAVGMIIGIQFMVGSVDDKAKIKETVIPYVIGVFVVFASFTIWKIVVTIGNDITDAQLPNNGTTRTVLAQMVHIYKI